MTWMLLSKTCLSLAWLVWVVTRPFHLIDEAGAWVERRFTAKGLAFRTKAPGIARPV